MQREMVDVAGAHVAQLVEHVLGKDEVTRSIRVVGSMQSLLAPEAYERRLGRRGNFLSRGWYGEGEV